MNLSDNVRVIKNYKQIAVEEIDFATVIVNKSKIDSNNMMDENIHLYFENQEVCLRLKKQGKNRERIFGGAQGVQHLNAHRSFFNKFY